MRRPKVMIIDWKPLGNYRGIVELIEPVKPEVGYVEGVEAALETAAEDDGLQGLIVHSLDSDLCHLIHKIAQKGIPVMLNSNEDSCLEYFEHEFKEYDNVYVMSSYTDLLSKARELFRQN